jgi:hypothetical protein
MVSGIGAAYGVAPIVILPGPRTSISVFSWALLVTKIYYRLLYQGMEHNTAQAGHA